MQTVFTATLVIAGKYLALFFVLAMLADFLDGRQHPPLR